MATKQVDLLVRCHDLVRHVFSQFKSIQEESVDVLIPVTFFLSCLLQTQINFWLLDGKAYEVGHEDLPLWSRCVFLKRDLVHLRHDLVCVELRLLRHCLLPWGVSLTSRRGRRGRCPPSSRCSKCRETGRWPWNRRFTAATAETSDCHLCTCQEGWSGRAIIVIDL